MEIAACARIVVLVNWRRMGGGGEFNIFPQDIFSYDDRCKTKLNEQ